MCVNGKDEGKRASEPVSDLNSSADGQRGHVDGHVHQTTRQSVLFGVVGCINRSPTLRQLAPHTSRDSMECYLKMTRATMVGKLATTTPQSTLTKTQTWETK